MVGITGPMVVSFHNTPASHEQDEGIVWLYASSSPVVFSRQRSSIAHFSFTNVCLEEQNDTLQYKQNRNLQKSNADPRGSWIRDAFWIGERKIHLEEPVRKYENSRCSWRLIGVICRNLEIFGRAIVSRRSALSCSSLGWRTALLKSMASFT